jgi:DNA (cytosine-5)-methyltransferase 1
LIEPVRELLLTADVPFVIENVGAARPWLQNPMTLCGTMFDRPTYRHRLFESSDNLTLTAPVQQPETVKRNKECLWSHPTPTAKAGHWKPGYYVSVSGHERKEPVRAAMGIDWMTNRESVAEALPPYMTHEVGRQVLAQLLYSKHATSGWLRKPSLTAPTDWPNRLPPAHADYASRPWSSPAD